MTINGKSIAQNSNNSYTGDPIKKHYKASVSNLTAEGELRANQTYLFAHDGTNWICLTLDYDSTYTAMSLSELNTGTVTSIRGITAAILNAGIHQNADIAWDSTNKKITQLSANAAVDKLQFIQGNNISLSAAANSLTIGLPTTMTGFTSITSTSFVGDLTGNASTATSLNHSLTFGNGTYVFDGSADVTVPVYDGSYT